MKSHAHFTAFSCLIMIASGGCGGEAPPPKPTIAGSSATVFDPAASEAESSAISDRIDEVFEEIAAGRFAQVYDAYASVALRDEATLEKFETICERINVCLGALTEKQLQQLEINPVGGSLTASATYATDFERGSGTLFVVMEKVDGAWMLSGLNVNAPELLDDPADFRQPTEIHVVDSDPALPGTFVDVLDLDQTPAAVLIENAQVLNVRWRIANPFVGPTAPVEGFVTLVLSPEQTQLLESAGTLSIRNHIDPEEPTAAP